MSTIYFNERSKRTSKPALGEGGRSRLRIPSSEHEAARLARDDLGFTHGAPSDQVLLQRRHLQTENGTRAETRHTSKKGVNAIDR